MSGRDQSLPRLPRRPAESHKGDFGRALIIGGSRGMSGAVSLTGMATLRGGAGLVTLAVPDACLDTVAAHEPSYMTVALPCDPRGRIRLDARATLEERLAGATVVACGPGLGRSDDVAELVDWLYRTVDVPLVVDADGLNALAARPDALSEPGGPRVLTPHPGEFRRLTRAWEWPDEEPERQARALAQRCGAIVVLKSHRTLVLDSRDTWRNSTGNPGMATGGTGDVLTGIITAMLSQGMTPWDAARLAVHAHGLAGDLAAAELGEVAMIASDLIRYLPAALRGLESPR